MSYMSPEVYTYISAKSNDPIVEWKVCAVSWARFAVFQSDRDFYERISPVFNWKKYRIPTPTLCPEERQRRRLMFRNERKLYRRRCDATWESIISIYAPNSSSRVYSPDFWLWDEWNPLTSGRIFDFEKDTFFWQLRWLTLETPSKSLVSEFNENCEYTSICGYCKDCYMTTASEYSQNCYYGHLLQRCEDVMDSSFVFDSRVCYGCVDVTNSYKCFYSSGMQDCNNCYNSEQLTNCSFCIECSGLDWQHYCIRNEKVTKEEFVRYLQDYSLKKVDYSSSVRPALHLLNSEGCLAGSVIHSSKVVCSYEIENAQDVRYSQVIVDWKNLLDCSHCYIECEKSYEVMSALSTFNNLFSAFVYHCSDVFYSLNCSHSNHLFGCSNLRNKSYCIFNKQYSESDYNDLVPKIIEYMQETWEWWEFFDPSLSPFGYNETVAQEYFPLTKEQWLLRWYAWQDETFDPMIPDEIQTFSWDQIASDITTVDDTILKKILLCEETQRPFRVIKQELDFYRKHGIPLPRQHPDSRHVARSHRRPPRSMFLRKCDLTWVQILSVYPDHVTFSVYADQAYNQEKFW